MCPVSNALLFQYICISGLHFTTLPILIYLYIVAVICGKTAVTWFAALTNQHRSAFSIPHFTLRIPNSTIPHFTHTRRLRVHILHYPQPNPHFYPYPNPIPIYKPNPNPKSYPNLVI